MGTANGGIDEKTHRNGLLGATDVAQAQQVATSGCYASIDMEYAGQKVAVGGITASAHGCDTLAMDGFLVTGVSLAYEFATKVFTVNGTTAPAAADTFTPPATFFANAG